MKLGLLSDIHEDVVRLETALDQFRRDAVDQIIVLGDVVETSELLDQTCRLLHEAGAVGVWGNHDYGLCRELADSGTVHYPPAVASFMSSLRPKLVTEDGYFAHVEPWLNPEDIFDLWFFEGMPKSTDRLDRIFGVQGHRLMFAGHYHQWLIVHPEGPGTWRGDQPVVLSPPHRYFIVVGALCEGQYATFDTETFQLTPFNLPSHAAAPHQVAGGTRRERKPHSTPPRSGMP